MPDNVNQTPWQPEQSSQAQAAVASVSAPPVEVAIRTMASDLASLGETGGGPPRAVNVSVQPQAIIGVDGKKTFVIKPVFIWIATALAGIAILFLGGYYLLPLISPSERPNGPSVTARATSTAPSVSTPTLEHRSVFRQQADGTFVLDVVSSMQGLKAYAQTVNAFLGGVSASSSFFEAELQDARRNTPSAAEFFASMGPNVFGQNFLEANFNPDFTLFFFRDKNGIWPGYVFELLPNKSPILLQQDVKKIESGVSIANLFLNDPGLPDGVFRDGLTSGQPFRIENFSDKKSVFLYGWFFNKYLIVSTSLEGLAKALAHF